MTALDLEHARIIHATRLTHSEHSARVAVCESTVKLSPAPGVNLAGEFLLMSAAGPHGRQTVLTLDRARSALVKSSRAGSGLPEYTRLPPKPRFPSGRGFSFDLTKGFSGPKILSVAREPPSGL